MAVWTSARETLGDTEWIFFTYDYSGVGCGDNIYNTTFL